MCRSFLVVDGQDIPVECSLVTVEWMFSVVCYAFIVQFVSRVAFGALGCPVGLDCKAYIASVALWTSQVVGVDGSVIEVGLPDDEPCKTILEYARLYFAVVDFLLVAVGGHGVTVFLSTFVDGQK